MPLINDPTNTRSNFPTSLDALPVFSNGTGVNSTIDAETWNTLESAILRLETHTQKTPLFIDAADRKRVCTTKTFNLGSPLNQVLVTVDTLSAAQLAFLNNNLQSTGSMFFLDVVHLSGTDDCVANLQPLQNQVSAYIFRTDPSQNLSGGLYQIKLTILGY